MFASLFLFALNRLLRDTGWARAAFARCAGRPVRITLPPFSCDFAPDDEGYCHAIAAAQPEVAFLFPADAPLRLMRGREALMAAVHITGNAEYAQLLADVFRHLQWDAEEDLAHLFGDVVAHRLFPLLRRGPALVNDLASRLAANAAECLAYESRLLIGKAEFDAHRQAVNALDYRLNQFDHRLRKLSRPTMRRSQ